MKKKEQNHSDEDTMRDHYDFDYSKAIWGKHAKRMAKEESNVVKIDLDVHEVFPDASSVNDALRKYIAISELVAPVKPASSNGQKKRRARSSAKPAVKA